MMRNFMLISMKSKCRLIRLLFHKDIFNYSNFEQPIIFFFAFCRQFLYLLSHKSLAGWFEIKENCHLTYHNKSKSWFHNSGKKYLFSYFILLSITPTHQSFNNFILYSYNNKENDLYISYSFYKLEK